MNKEKTEFNPHNPNYKKVDDLPLNQRHNYSDFENGFVKKVAMQRFDEAVEKSSEINNSRRTKIDKLLGRKARKQITFQDVLQEKAKVRDQHIDYKINKQGQKEERKIQEQLRSEFVKQKIDVPAVAAIFNLVDNEDNILAAIAGVPGHTTEKKNGIGLKFVPDFYEDKDLTKPINIEVPSEEDYAGLINSRLSTNESSVTGKGMYSEHCRKIIGIDKGRVVKPVGFDDSSRLRDHGFDQGNDSGLGILVYETNDTHFGDTRGLGLMNSEPRHNPYVFYPNPKIVTPEIYDIVKAMNGLLQVQARVR